MSSYDDLSSTIDAIIDAAIESAMIHFGCHRHGDAYVLSEVEQGNFDLAFPEVSGPASGAPHWIREPSYVFSGVAPKWLAEIADIYSSWDANIRELFAPWQDLPDESSAAPPVNHVYDAARQISLGQDVENGLDLEANPNMGDLADANGQLDAFAGGTVAVFRRLYSRRLEVAIVPNLVQALGSVIEGAVAEIAIWPQARKNVASVADAMLAGMKAARPAPAANPTDAILSVAGILTATVALFASGPGAIFVSGVGLSVGIADKLKGKDKPKPVKGSTPDEVFDQARDALRELDSDIFDEELKIGQQCDDLAGRMATEATLYDLKVPDGFLDSTSARQLIDKADVIKVDADRLRTIGRVLIPNVAAQFKAAASKLDPYAAETAWQRGGSIGWPSSGPSSSFEYVCNALATLLIGTDQELRFAGEHLAIAADYFDKTDGQVHQELDAQQTRMDREGRAQLPYSDPTPPPPAYPGPRGQQPY